MKKLSLIIPLLKSHSQIYKISSLLFIFISIPFLSFADKYGCYVNEYSFYIFHNQYAAMGGHPNYLFSSDANNNPDTYYQRDGRCPQNMNTPCYLYNFNGTLKATGYATDFSLEYCPIDDYIPLLFIFTAGTAFSLIRKRKPVVQINEDIPHHSSL